MEGVIEDEDEDEEMEVAGVDGDQAHDADSSSNCSSDEDDFSKSVPPEVPTLCLWQTALNQNIDGCSQ